MSLPARSALWQTAVSPSVPYLIKGRWQASTAKQVTKIFKAKPKKLDVIANNLLLDAPTKNPHCAGVASEELDEISPAHDDGTLLVTFDPLDGSSNIDINMTVGTIFSILPYQRVGSQATEADFYKKVLHNWQQAILFMVPVPCWQ